MTPYTAEEYDRAFKFNVLLGIFILALFVAAAILETLLGPDFMNLIFSALGVIK